MSECRVGCGACCIAPSISSAIPGMPGGKPAGVRCVQLTDDNRCMLFGTTRAPGRLPRPAALGRDVPRQRRAGLDLAGRARAGHPAGRKSNLAR